MPVPILAETQKLSTVAVPLGKPERKDRQWIWRRGKEDSVERRNTEEDEGEAQQLATETKNCREIMSSHFQGYIARCSIGTYT